MKNMLELSNEIKAQLKITSDIIPLCNAISFLCVICLCAFAYNIVELMGGLVLFHQDNLYLFVDMRTCWGRCEVGATDRSKTVTLQVFTFVNCLWRLF
jgi:hypothetical protein